MAALTVKVGPSAYDSMVFARSMLEDDTAPYTIPDSRFTIYADAVAKDFSRFAPLDDIVGTPYNQTSPLNTVAGQQRYVCTSGNGFVANPTRIVEVKGNQSGLNASTDTAYFFLDPYLTARGFLGPAAIDQPSQRVIRDSYLDELAQYGKTFYDVVRDRPTGKLAIDLYPIPASSFPVYVRYQAVHPQTGSVPDLIYVTIPDEYTQAFSELLYAQALFEQAGRLALRGRVKSGLIEREGTVADMRLLAVETRERVYSELGGNSAVALVG